MFIIAKFFEYTQKTFFKSTNKVDFGSLNYKIKEFKQKPESICLSAAKSHKAGGANPVSDSFIPASSLTRFKIACTSSSFFFNCLS